MSSVNKVILIGNLGADPEVRYVMENVPVATFRIATTERYKDKNGEWQDVTDWHNIVAWRFQAETAQKFLKKGTQVYVEGRLKSRSYDDKDGNKRYVTEVVADQLFTTGKREGTGNSNWVPSGGERHMNAQTPAPAEAPRPADVNAVPIDDDLPF